MTLRQHASGGARGTASVPFVSPWQPVHTATRADVGAVSHARNRDPARVAACWHGTRCSMDEFPWPSGAMGWRRCSLTMGAVSTPPGYGPILPAGGADGYLPLLTCHLAHHLPHPAPSAVSPCARWQATAEQHRNLHPQKATVEVMWQPPLGACACRLSRSLDRLDAVRDSTTGLFNPIGR